MYGKIFESIYEGTLAGHWEAIVTMQQLVVLADADGVVDMTPEAIARRTTIPLKIITKGLEFLAQPDRYTRTPGEDGKRIVLLDDHRPWGWRLVNHGKYKRLRNMKEKLEADRIRQEEKRKQINDVASESQKSPKVAKVAHAVCSTQYADAVTPPESSAKALSAGSNGSGVAYIPLNDGSEFSVSSLLASELATLYPAVDVPQTLNEIRAWNLANPQRRKTKRGVLQHINSWLSKEQNRGPQRT